MKKSIAFLLLIFFVGDAVCQAPSHLKYFGFYLVNTGVDDKLDNVVKTNYIDEVGYWTNLNQSLAADPNRNISADLVSMNNECTKPFMAVEQIFWRRVGSMPNKSGNNYDRYPDWQARWNTFKTINAAYLKPSKIGCFYVCDEPLWNDIPSSELDEVTQTIKNDFPSIPTFYVEAYPEVANMVVPLSMDWIAFDQYFIFDPKNNTTYKNYLSTLKSKRTNNQRILIIGDTHWVPSYGTAGVTTTAMESTVQSYYDLAAADNEVIGLIGYLWPGGFDEPNELGGRNLPTNVVNKMVNIGNLIKANYSPCNADNEAPTVPIGINPWKITSNSITLSWSSSFDVSGVTGYEIFVNGVWKGATTKTSYVVSNLSCNTTYNIQINAFDKEAPPHNISAKSTARYVKTSNCSGSSAAPNTAAIESVEGATLAGVNVYPNPANEYITIEGLVNGANVNIIDATGQIVLSTTTKKMGTAKLSLANIKAGIYVVKVEVNGKIHKSKLIKE
jgi:chitodextrinase